MNEVSVSNFKKLTVEQIKALMPFAVTSDGIKVGIFGVEVKPLKGKTKCPNCKFTYEFTADDGRAPFFTIRHP